MATADLAPTVLPADWSVADLIHHFAVPPERIRLQPGPGTATEDDVRRIADHEGRLFELVDGTLVEKPMGLYESQLAVLIGYFLHKYLETHDLGHVFGEGGAMRILSRQIRIPDVSFVTWERRGRGVLAPIPALVPNLAVEVLSPSNSAAEMQAKLREYFAAGVELVWYIEPRARAAKIFTSPTDIIEIDEQGFLDGGEVLPGLQISLRELFARADGQQP